VLLLSSPITGVLVVIGSGSCSGSSLYHDCSGRAFLKKNLWCLAGGCLTVLQRFCCSFPWGSFVTLLLRCYPSGLSFLDSKVTIGENDSGQRKQTQNGG
jgi:hypothetical protein